MASGLNSMEVPRANGRAKALVDGDRCRSHLVVTGGRLQTVEDGLIHVCRVDMFWVTSAFVLDMIFTWILFVEHFPIKRIQEGCSERFGCFHTLSIWPNRLRNDPNNMRFLPPSEAPLRSWRCRRS